MSVLVEALSLVVPRRALDVSWPGGTAAFLQAMCAEDCPSRRVCADDSLASISFFTPEDAEVVAAQLRDCGLLEIVDDRFQDFAFVDQRLGPTMPCPWLHWQRHPDGFTYAWLEGSDSSTMAAPADWEPEQSRRLMREDLRDDRERMLKLAEEDKFEIWLDFQTGQLSRGLARPEPETSPRGGAASIHAAPRESTPPASTDSHAAASGGTEVSDEEIERLIAEVEADMRPESGNDEASEATAAPAPAAAARKRPSAPRRETDGLFAEAHPNRAGRDEGRPLENS